MRYSILFIINPKSGTGKSKTAKDIISECLHNNKFDIQIEFTRYSGHAFELAGKNKSKFDIIGVVGGDGTINEVIEAIANSTAKIAIIPAGSGNGLARTLKIPLKTSSAIEIINNLAPPKTIDTVKINEKRFVNVAGMGFDAYIGFLFDNAKKRGFFSYLKLVVKEFRKYKPVKYHLKIDETEYIKEAFLISFANSTQFGNNVHIAPEAKIDDGIIDVIILKKFPLIASLFLTVKLFRKKLHKSKYYEKISAKKIEIKNNNKMLMHIDGEPYLFEQDIYIKIEEKSLNVIIP